MVLLLFAGTTLDFKKAMEAPMNMNNYFQKAKRQLLYMD
jgi:hypothetical protein